MVSISNSIEGQLEPTSKGAEINANLQFAA